MFIVTPPGFVGIKLHKLITIFHLQALLLSFTCGYHNSSPLLAHVARILSSDRLSAAAIGPGYHADEALVYRLEIIMRA